MRTCISRNSSSSAAPKVRCSMARARSCIWTGRITARAPLLPLWRQARRAPPAQAGTRGGRRRAETRAWTAQTPEAPRRGRRRGPSGAAIRRAREARAARGRRRRGFATRALPRKREPRKPAKTAPRRASSARDPGGGAVGADVAAGRASGQTRRRASWELRASRARCVPSGATARARGTIPKATMLRSRPRRTGRTATRARAGRGPRRVSLTRASRVLNGRPKRREEPATSASVSAQPEAEQSSALPRKGWWRR